MESTDLSSRIFLSIHPYRNHILVFLIVLFIGLSLAHPSVLLNDEFITTNQLRQLHSGHQILINEGKYGLQQNGSMSGYFAYKSNLLGYTLFYPLISLPAFWMLDITGENCVYFILCLWTIIALTIILMINHFYPKFSFVRSFQWTPFAIVAVFVLFFINLYFYANFPINSSDNYPEIIAIVFTNMFLLSFSAVFMYEINRTIFENTAYSFFGTMVCLFSSSYFLWATHCKDHILVLPIFVGVFLCLIRLMRTNDYWYLSLAFIFSGLLAWIRPELALWIFLAGCATCLYCLIKSRAKYGSTRDMVLILCSPFFTLIGALPFFLNNYMITKNFFLPVQSIYLSDKPSIVIVNSTQQFVPATGIRSVESVILMFVPNISPQNFLTDLAGIFFYPYTGSISIFALVPLFLVTTILAIIFVLSKKIQFLSDEKKYLGICLLISLSVFLAYVSVINILNVDIGITPDIRYLSPMYLPLTVTGLIFVKKMNLLSEKSADSIKWLFVVTSLGLVISLIFLPIAYAPGAFASTLSIPIGKFFSIYTLALCFLTIGTILVCKYLKKGNSLYEYLIFLLCSVPLFWQVNATFVFRSFSGYAGYTFWIPIIRLIWELIVNLILIKNVTP